jgi:hypothetical protein
MSPPAPVPPLDMKIGYMNVRALWPAKWQVLVELVNSKQFDFLFLSETWYRMTDTTTPHPFFVSTTSPSKIYDGRQHGGMILIAHPSLHPHIADVVSSEYSISFRCNSVRILGVYAPPSLSPVNFLSLFTSANIPDLILGDINTRFGIRFGDKNSGPATRVQTIDRIKQLFNLRHLIPKSGKTRVDHAFASPLLRASMDISSAPVPSDHDLIVVSFPRPNLTPALYDDLLEQSAVRFNIRRLSDPVALSYFARLCEYNSEHLSLVVTSAIQNLPRLPVPDRRDIINSIDSIIRSTIIDICSHSIGSYIPREAEIIGNHKTHVPPFSADDVIRAVKSNHRNSTKKLVIHSRSPEVTPIEDACQFLSQLYSVPATQYESVDTSLQCVGDVEIASMFSPDSVKGAILSYPSSRSCGPDGIHIAILKAISTTSLINPISDFFKLCGLTGISPVGWNHSSILLIPKKDEHLTVESTRPISLTVTFRRIFEKILLQYIYSSPHTANIRTFASCQAGFRHGFSTLTHALTSDTRSRYWDVDTVFLDFKNAYDTVPIPILLRKLHSRNAPIGLISLVDSLFSTGSAQVVINKRVSAPFKKSRGLQQGSLLSPFLFLCFIDDLAYRLTESISRLEFGSPTLFFADDIVLHATSERDMQTLLNVSYAWASDNYMSFNIRKCGVVSRRTPSYYLNLEAIPNVTTYTYLGFTHTARGINWLDDLRSFVSKSVNSFKSLCIVGDNWPECARTHAFKIFVRSKHEYGAPIFYHLFPSPKHKPPSSLTDLYTSAVRWTTRTSHVDALARRLAAVPLPQHRFASLACSFQLHLASMHPLNPLRLLLNNLSKRNFTARSAILLRRISDRICCGNHLFTRIDISTYPTRDLRDKVQEEILSFTTTAFNSSLLPSYIFLTRPPLFPRSCPPMDISLKISDLVDRRLLISWRSNRFGRRYRCPCYAWFTRRHVIDCNLVANDVLDKYYFLYINDINLHPALASTTYSLIDSLLNHHLPQVALSTLTHIHNRLLPPET